MFAMIAGAFVLPTGWAFGVIALMLAGMLGFTALSPEGPQYRQGDHRDMDAYRCRGMVWESDMDAYRSRAGFPLVVGLLGGEDVEELVLHPVE